MSIASARFCINAAQGLIGARFPISSTLRKGSLVGAMSRSSTSLHVRKGISLNRPTSTDRLQHSALSSSIKRPHLKSEVLLRSFSVRPAKKKAPDQLSKMAAPKELSSAKHFGGFNKRYEHESTTIGVPMKFTVYFPPAAEKGKVPVRG